VDLTIERGKITVVTGVSGSGKSSLAFDTILAEAQRRFLHTLSHYSRQFLDLQARPSVRSVTGLSPAVSLAQNETMPSRRATVGTLTDLSELFGVLFARFGEQFCPKHNEPTSSLAPADIAGHITAAFSGQTVAVCAPVATARKGTFRKQFTDLTGKGYARFYVDGETLVLPPVPDLGKDEKHTIKVLVDIVKVRPGNEARLLRSVETTAQEGEGYVEVYTTDGSGNLQLESGQTYSLSGACSVCGFSWPALDARNFSANSLGACKSCRGYGTVAGADEPDDDESEDDGTEDDGGVAENETPVQACTACQGSGLDPDLRAIRIGGASILDWMLQPVSDLTRKMQELKSGPYAGNPAFMRVHQEAEAALARISHVGLGYLALARRVRSLSGGELQRLKLAGILSGNLRGVLYVLDEPSQGLHPQEIDTIAAVLRQLCERGNTILIVDHDEGLMRHADRILDLGPGGGVRGGRLLATFHPQQAAAFAAQSETAAHLALPHEQRKTEALPARAFKPEGFIELQGAKLHNLDIDRVRFPLAGMTSVVGVSGAGKSSLVLSTLWQNLRLQIAAAQTRGPKRPKSPPKPPPFYFCRQVSGFDGLDQVHLIDRKPIAKSGSSIPASWLGILTMIRDLYASLPEGQVLGLTARHFSLSVEAGRCPECKGRGEVSLKMRFLADARTRCPLCRGKRFKANVLNVKYLGLSISDVLDLTLDEAADHFRNHKKIISRLQPAVDLGLGYLKLGQPSVSLSGGEAQRLKLVPMLARPHGQTSMIILDEPTTGLHFRDVSRLLKVLRDLTERGTTVVMIEHNGDVIAASDWIVEIGPGAADAGGRLLFEGPLARFAAGDTLSARYFRS
jgi:excinuclease ABC subunit A